MLTLPEGINDLVAHYIDPTPADTSGFSMQSPMNINNKHVSILIK